MKEEYKILEQVSLFKGIDSSDYSSILNCLGMFITKYPKNKTIILAGEEITSLGIVLSGSVQVVRDDILGNRTLVAGLSEGDIFAESLACAGVKESPVSVYANEASTVLWISIKRIITTCSNVCSFHTRLITNLLNLLANKNLYLNQKMEFLSKRSIREKILSYLAFQKEISKTSSFLVPLNRNEMADYLCVDRSAMSRELSKLRDEGIIEYKKNKFNLL